MDLTLSSLTHLSDVDVLHEVKRLVHRERQATARLIAALMELDARSLYLAEGCSSLFTYCTQVLHLSEHTAYGRIQAARAARRFPVILERLADGSINLTTVGLLAAHLTATNCDDVLLQARHQPKRVVEEIVAKLRPKPDVASAVRKLPAPKRRVAAQFNIARPSGHPLCPKPCHPRHPKRQRRALRQRLRPRPRPSRRWHRSDTKFN